MKFECDEVTKFVIERNQDAREKKITDLKTERS